MNSTEVTPKESYRFRTDQEGVVSILGFIGSENNRYEENRHQTVPRTHYAVKEIKSLFGTTVAPIDLDFVGFFDTEVISCIQEPSRDVRDKLLDLIKEVSK